MLSRACWLFVTYLFLQVIVAATESNDTANSSKIVSQPMSGNKISVLPLSLNITSKANEKTSNGFSVGTDKMKRDAEVKDPGNVPDQESTDEDAGDVTTESSSNMIENLEPGEQNEPEVTPANNGILNTENEGESSDDDSGGLEASSANGTTLEFKNVTIATPAVTHPTTNTSAHANTPLAMQDTQPMKNRTAAFALASINGNLLFFLSAIAFAYVFKDFCE